MHRNRGVQHVIYPEPQFPLHPKYKYSTEVGQRVPYQPPYETVAKREQAASRDRRAQRAWWLTNLTFLETKKKILDTKRIELERGLSAKMTKALESRSDLGMGYHNYQFLH